MGVVFVPGIVLGRDLSLDMYRNLSLGRHFDAVVT